MCSETGPAVTGPWTLMFSLFFKQAYGGESTTQTRSSNALKRGVRPRSGIHAGLQGFAHHRDRSFVCWASNAARSSAVWPIDEWLQWHGQWRYRVGSYLRGAPRPVCIPPRGSPDENRTNPRANEDAALPPENPVTSSPRIVARAPRAVAHGPAESTR